LTIKNHYIPCFWTAFWNSEYLEKTREKLLIDIKPRKVEVYSLNLKADCIFKNKTENVFFEKKAGTAELTRDNVLDYCRRTSPDKLDGLIEYFEKNSSDVLLDFENHFTEFENLWKPTLQNVIINRKISNLEEKTYLSFFIFFQIIRNHNHLGQAVKHFQDKGMAKFEVFLNLKDTISNPKRLMELILPYLTSEWKLYNTTEYNFPISDNPILIRPMHIIFPLAPDMLLEIDLKKKVSENNICINYNILSPLKYNEMKKRTIENSSREIVFCNKKLLEQMKKSSVYKKHLNKTLLSPSTPKSKTK